MEVRFARRAPVYRATDPLEDAFALPPHALQSRLLISRSSSHASRGRGYSRLGRVGFIHVRSARGLYVSRPYVSRPYVSRPRPLREARPRRLLKSTAPENARSTATQGNPPPSDRPARSANSSHFRTPIATPNVMSRIPLRSSSEVPDALQTIYEKLEALRRRIRMRSSLRSCRAIFRG